MESPFFLLLVPYGLIQCMYGLAQCVMQSIDGVNTNVSMPLFPVSMQAFSCETSTWSPCYSYATNMHVYMPYIWPYMCVRH